MLIINISCHKVSFNSTLYFPIHFALIYDLLNISVRNLGKNVPQFVCHIKCHCAFGKSHFFHKYL